MNWQNFVIVLCLVSCIFYGIDARKRIPKVGTITTIWNDTKDSMIWESIHAFNNDQSFVASRLFDAGMDVHINPTNLIPSWTFLPPQPTGGAAIDFVAKASRNSDIIAGVSAYDDDVEGVNDTLRLFKWHAAEPTHDWEFVGPKNWEIGDMDVSINGNYIGLLISSRPSSSQDSMFYLFNSSSKVPIYRHALPGRAIKVLFTPNETLVYYSVDTIIHLFNIATMKDQWTGTLPSNSYLINTCGNGNYILVGNEYTALPEQLMQWNGTGFISIFTTQTQMESYTSSAAISSGCDTLVEGWSYESAKGCGVTVYYPLSKKQGYTYDFLNSTDAGQNVLSMVTFSNQPTSPFVVSIWGDEANNIPQLYVFEQNSATPATKILSGSAFVTDTLQNSNGTFIPLGYKGTHANEWGYGEIAYLQYTTSGISKLD